MTSVLSVTCILFLLIEYSISDLCEKCDCYPEYKPVQVFCENIHLLTNQNLTITDIDIDVDSEKDELEMIYIYGYNSVEFLTNSIAQLTASVNIFIHHCSQVIFNKNAVKLIHSLTIANVEDLIFERDAVSSMKNMLSIKLTNVKIKTLTFHSFYDISTLNILDMNNVSIQHIEKEAIIIDHGATLKLQNCVVEKIESGAIIYYGGKALLKNNLFKYISKEGISLYMENLISITNCSFHEYNKSALNLESPNTEISFNYFESLPASALTQINTNDSIDFTHNIIKNIDLGGVILDMDYRRINFANNTIDCDCSPKKTSVLIPIDTFPVFIQVDHIFYNNYCHTNCSVSLKDLSHLLLNRYICNNSTENELTDEQLCNTTLVCKENSTITTTTTTTSSSSSSSRRTIINTVNASCVSLHYTYVTYKAVLFISTITYIVRSMIT